MGRLATIEPANSTGRVKEIFEGPLKGKSFNIFKAMANSPAALDVYLGMSGALNNASLNAKEREAIQLAIGEANGCGYCTAAHTAIGKGAGLTDDQVLGSRRGTVGDTKLNAVVKFALAIHEKRGYASTADVQAFKAAGYGDGAVAEVVACYALAIYTNYFNHVNETAVDFPAAPKL